MRRAGTDLNTVKNWLIDLTVSGAAGSKLYIFRVHRIRNSKKVFILVYYHSLVELLSSRELE